MTNMFYEYYEKSRAIFLSWQRETVGCRLATITIFTANLGNAYLPMLGLGVCGVLWTSLGGVVASPVSVSLYVFSVDDYCYSLSLELAVALINRLKSVAQMRRRVSQTSLL